MRHILGAACAAALTSSTTWASATADLPSFLPELSAGTIAVISDGEFVGRTYATGRLAPAEAGLRDALTILTIEDGTVRTASLNVSNSVTAAPEVIALTPDGATAFVVERLGERPAGGETVRDLSPGNRLFAVDLSDKANPVIADTIEIAPFPEALSVGPQGDRVAVVSNTPDASYLQIAAFADGRFGEVEWFSLGDLGVEGSSSGPRGGITATNVHWHPSGRFLAVNINTQNRVAFFAVTEQDGALNVRSWGNIVEVGRDPFVGRFTPDGRYYLTSDWGRDFTASDLEGRLPQAPSSISVIRIADPQAQNSDVRHERVSGAETDISAEGIAISPDGRLVATINMRGTPFLQESPRFQREASVTLLTFDTETGAIAKVADYPLDGVLPEGGSFDLTGDHFLATVFEGHAGANADSGAGLEVFRVVRGERPKLERLGRVPVPHGAHHVVVAQ